MIAEYGQVYIRIGRFLVRICNFGSFTLNVSCVFEFQCLNFNNYAVQQPTCCAIFSIHKIVKMLQSLMNTLRMPLNNLHTPSVRSSVQVLDALNSVLPSLQ